MHSHLRCACALIHSLLFLVAASAWTAGGLSTPAMAQTWTGASSASWHDPANWSPPVVPGPADAAVINAGLVTVSEPISVGSLTLGTTSGFATTLSLAAPLTMNTEFIWNSGTISGATLTVAPGALAALSPSSGTRTLSNTLDNHGTLLLGGATLTLTGGHVRNFGQITAASRSGSGSPIPTIVANTPPATLTNAPGAVIRNTGVRPFNIGLGTNPVLIFNNAGALIADNAPINIVATTTLDTGTELSGPGGFSLLGPTTTNAPLSIASPITLTSGTLTLNAPLQLHSTLTWRAGIIQGPGPITVQPSGVLLPVELQPKRLRTHLINFGEVRLGGTILTLGNVTLDNHNTLRLTGNTSIRPESSNPPTIDCRLIIHPGALIVSSGISANEINSGSSDTPPMFRSLGGNIHIEGGQLQIVGGIFDGGEVTGPGELVLGTSRAELLQIGPSGLTVNRLRTFTSPGRIEGPGMLTIREQLRFGAGSFACDVTILPEAQVTPAFSSSRLFFSGNVFNHGLIDSQNTPVYLGSQNLVNFGTVRVSGNPAILGYILDQPPATIVNTPAGTIEFSGTGTAILAFSLLHNEGTVRVASPALNIEGPLTMHGGLITAAANTAAQLSIFGSRVEVTAPSHLAIDTRFMRTVFNAQTVFGPSTLSAANIAVTVQNATIAPNLLSLRDSSLTFTTPLSTTPIGIAHITLSGRSTLLSSLPPTARVTFTPDPALTNSLTLPANFSSAGELTLTPPPIPGTAPLTLPLIAPSGFTNTGTLRIRPGISADMQGPFIQSAAGRTILTAPMGTPAAPALILAPGYTLGGTLALELPSGVPAPTCVSPVTLTSALRIPDPSALALSQLLPPPLSPAGLALRLRADPAQPTDLSLILAPLADLASIGGATTPDGLVTGDDFTAFLTAFAASDPLADLTGIGNPAAPPDGLITGDDFIAFIAAFATGCP